jgi:hypothetical protein
MNHVTWSSQVGQETSRAIGRVYDGLVLREDEASEVLRRQDFEEKFATFLTEMARQHSPAKPPVFDPEKDADGIGPAGS